MNIKTITTLIRKLIYILVALVIAIQSGCASVATTPEYKNVQVKQFEGTTYKKCLLRFGDKGGFRNQYSQVSNPNFMSSTLNMLRARVPLELVNRKICHEVEYSLIDPEQIRTYVNIIDPQRNSFEKKKDDPNLLEVSFFEEYDYSPNFVSGQGVALWWMVYGITLGLLPVGQQAGMDYIVVVKKPDQEPQVQRIKNSKWVWFWSPFYFKESSDRDFNAMERNRSEIRIDTLNEILNGI